jgi:paired amphipathic helix protein Sin3a
MTIRMSLGTYRLFYEGGSEDFLFRRWGKEEHELLCERARAKHDERRKSRWVQAFEKG